MNHDGLHQQHGLSHSCPAILHRREVDTVYTASPYPPDMASTPDSLILANIRSAYAILVERFSVAIHTQIGDAPRLDEVRTQALELMHRAEQVSCLCCTHTIVQWINFQCTTRTRPLSLLRSMLLFVQSSME